MKNITVIGSGTMGNGIAHTFAQYGFKVSLVDISEDALKKAVQTIANNLDRQVNKGGIDEATKSATLGNITTYTDLQTGAANADLVVEAATENREIKLKLFKDLSSICKSEAILASNTSSISITQIAAVTNDPSRVIGMHFMNPVPVMKLVEVIRGYATSDEVTNTIMELSRQLGNLFEGVAGVHEIDTVMKLGMAHPMGPLQLADFIGLDVCLAILRVLYDGFGNQKYAPCPLLVNMVTAGHLGVKSGRGFYKYTPGSKDLVVADKFRR
jgi:3-hydroxybutyryl-CoA dehydrogenase